jgi:hypothetical protein
VFCLQILQQPLEGLLVAVVVLPVGEVGNEVLPDLLCGVLPSVGVERFPFPDLLKRRQADGEKHLALLPDLVLTGICNLRLHPFAVHAVIGEDQQKAVIDTNSFVNLFVEFPPTFDVVW